MNSEFEMRLAALGTGIADVEERFIRGSARGAENQQTSSTVWLQHRPTGIEVRASGNDRRLPIAS